MKETLLSIQGLHAAAESGEDILRGLDLTICKGETHVIIGPNGAGKSTLANVVMGHPHYSVEAGTMQFEGEDLLAMKPDARARAGLFMSFQAPEEVDGITVADFLKTARSATSDKPIKLFAFQKELAKTMELLQIPSSYAQRYLNVGFSGGEKKKSEILQLLTLNPKLAILDETDSGLDVDAVKIVSEGVRHFKNEDNALLIISHSTRLLESLDVDYVHILVDGVIVHTGDRSLIERISQEGFSAFTQTGEQEG